MTTKMYVTVLGAIALMASGCAGSAMSRPTTAYHVPRGQAAQPGSWNGSDSLVSAPNGTVRGRAAQPGSWLQDLNRTPRQYATGVPAGQAAQPGSWSRRVN